MILHIFFIYFYNYKNYNKVRQFSYFNLPSNFISANLVFHLLQTTRVQNKWERALINNTNDRLTSVPQSLYAASQPAFLDLTLHSHFLVHPI